MFYISRHFCVYTIEKKYTICNYKIEMYIFKLYFLIHRVQIISRIKICHDSDLRYVSPCKMSKLYFHYLVQKNALYYIHVR